MSRIFFFVCCFIFSFASSAAENSGKVSVVATFSILADLAEQVGGDKTNVISLVKKDEDAHVFHASPDDVRQVKQADILVINGLGFEGWLNRLIRSAGFDGQLVVASKGVDAIHLASFQGSHRHHHHAHHNERADPHAWQSIIAVKQYVKNIHASLVAKLPQHQPYFDQRLSDYMAKLDTLYSEFKIELAKLPDERKRFLVPHNAFAYLARDYDLDIHSLLGVSTESEASAAVLARVVRKVRSSDIQVMFSENVSDDRLIRQVQREASVKFGGSLISGALSEKNAPSYLQMMRYNLDQIMRALTAN